MTTRDDDRRMIRTKNRAINYPFIITELFIKEHFDLVPTTLDVRETGNDSSSSSSAGGGSELSE